MTRGAVVVGIGLAGLTPATLEAQSVLRRVPGTGQLGGSVLTTTSGGFGRPGSVDRTFRQWFRLPVRGSIVDSRLLSYNFAIRPTFSQRSSPGVEQSVDMRELGWDFGLQAFSTQPVSLSVTSHRASGSAGGGLGGRADFASSNLAAIANLRVRALPMRLEYNSRESENRWQSGTGLNPVAWSNDTRSMRFVAQNSKLHATVERFDFDDRIGSADFSMWNVSAQHRFRWGTGSRLQSSYNRSDRVGSTSYLRTSWTERVHLRHGSGANSDASYRLHSTRTQAGVTQSRALSYTLNTRYGRWVSFAVSGSSHSSRFNGTREQVRSITPRLSVRASLPHDVHLTVGGSYGYERRTREQTVQEFVSVVNESHAVDASRSFFLDQTNIDTASVVVRRSDEATIYFPGADYQLIVLGGTIEIVVPPASRIAEGDRVLVSYRFSLEARPSGSLANSSYDVSLSRRGITFSHRRGRRDGSEDGQDALLGFGTFDVMQTSLSARFATPLGRWDLNASVRNRRSSALDFSSKELSSSLSLPTRAGVQANVGASIRRSSSSGRVVAARSVFMTGNFTLWRRLNVQSRFQLWDIRVDGADTDRSASLDVNASRRIAAFELNGQAQFSRRFTPFDVNASRISLRVVRRF